MKRYLVVVLMFLFVGCSSIQIKSDDGSFRNDLKSEYYEKANYKCLFIADAYSWDILTDVNIDEIIQHGLKSTYFLQCFGARYTRLNKSGVDPGLDEDKLYIHFRRIYKFADGIGVKIVISETIQTKDHSWGLINHFVNYQEIFLNKKGQIVARENVPKKEAMKKEDKWLNRFKVH